MVCVVYALFLVGFFLMFFTWVGKKKNFYLFRNGTILFNVIKVNIC